LFPAIYSDKIIWADYRNCSRSLNNSELFMYDFSTSNETSIITGSECFVPAIYEDKIVWEYWPQGENTNSDIYMYNISTGAETQITEDESYQGSPAIYADRIIWRDERNQGSYIYMYAAGSNFPSAEFSAIPTSGSFPLKVKFTDKTNGSPTTWYWNFGDGNNSTRRNPEHIYSRPGNYTVTLSVRNAKGTDAETKVDYICAINGAANSSVEYFFSILNFEFLKVYLSISEFIASKIASIKI
ncbi:MAG: PKD domain-containing protein, partial [Methanosarcina sp.]